MAIRAGVTAFATALAFQAVGDLTGSLGLAGAPNGGHAPLEFLSEAHLFNMAGHAAVGCASAVMGGVGDRFYLAVLNSSPRRVKRVSLPKNPTSGELVHFPTDTALKKFDQSGRKFAAAARKAKVPVANAIDSDWLEFREPLAANGVVVEFVCGCDAGLWHEPTDVVDDT